MDTIMLDRGQPLSLWRLWWNAILLLRPAFSRLRTFMWFATIVAGLTVRKCGRFRALLLRARSKIQPLPILARKIRRSDQGNFGDVRHHRSGPLGFPSARRQADPERQRRRLSTQRAAGNRLLQIGGCRSVPGSRR